ncbi:MAG: glycosyltransferase family 2 protein, partial [Desulfuromonadales bacterium]|nr:glycosyltransferase family 2 protein [Desulfuromonadales bacterium]
SGFEVVEIANSEFDHGGTRQMGVGLLSDCDIIICVTQDAILADENALENIVACFSDEKVGAAYGRQLPRIGAEPFEAHARLFNYSPENVIKTFADRRELGIKTVFISNSFAAYRKKALAEVGGFPVNAILSEDTFVAAKMLLTDWKVAYCADATVYHSHDYTFRQEFKRYFDVGVFHGRESWIREQFGQAEGEGLRFMASEISYLWPKHAYLIPSSLLRCLFKYLGYKLGSREQYLPLSMKVKMSMNLNYWKRGVAG